MLQHHNHPPHHRYYGDLSGAFADLGTFLPIVIAILTLQQVDPAGLFVSFGIFALVVAAVYRRPIPIQPMKVVAAVVITQSLDPQTIAATGFLLGLTVLILTITGALDLIARKIPTPVLSGIQLGVGLMLAWAGVGLILDQPWIGISCAIALFVLLATPLNPFAAIIVVISACLWALATQQNTLPEITLGLHMPKWISFGWHQLWSSAQTIILPQLTLTLTNAIIATSVIAGHYFPDDKQRTTPTRLGFTTGILNILLAPFGGFPMCHGAGGLVVQHRFGARSWLTPTLFGISMLSLGIVLGQDALKLLLLIPLAAVGALLLYAGLSLAWNNSLTNAKPYELTVMGITGLCCPVFNVAVALLIGWLAFVLISKLTTKKSDKPRY